jgi:4-hydroxybenzoate polyprenyltransferase
MGARTLIAASAERDAASPSVAMHASQGRAMRLLSSIRWDEVILWQGTPLFGALFSIGSVTGDKAAALALLLAASGCLVAHVFALNDWSGAEGDLHEPSRAVGILALERGVRRTEMGHLCAALMVLGLLPLFPLGTRPVCIGLQIVILSALYSAPGLHFKGVPVLSSVIHIAGGLLHFLLAYSLFRPIDARGLTIGAFFCPDFRRRPPDP